MAPSQHLQWFEDNIEWFLALDPSLHAAPVPACPGWTVGDVIVHLTFGLGRGYPVAMRTAADAAESDPVDWSTSAAPADGALATFAEEMSQCLAAFRSTDPATPCWTYAGPGTAAFWFRRAAIETGLHRMDVAAAIGASDTVAEDRTGDAVIEAIEFALPFGAQILEIEPDAIGVYDATAGVTIQLGEGPVTAVIKGPSDALLQALWGRGTEGIEIDGDRRAVGAWLGVIEAAFAGR